MADDVQNILEHVGLFQQRMLQSDGRTHPIQVHLTQRFNQPWTNTKINQMSRKKKKLLHRAFKTKSSEDRAAYHEDKKYIQSECRKAYYRYINDMVAKPSEGEPHSLKRFWVFIKSRKWDNSGVSPLEKDGISHSDSQVKADILNKQFSSVFTNEDTASVPDMGPSPHPDMADINIHEPGVRKILSDLKPHSAADPDEIPARLLENFASVLARPLSCIFKASSDHGSNCLETCS